MLECWFGRLDNVFDWNLARGEGEVHAFGENLGFHRGETALAEVHNRVLCEGLGAAEMGFGSKRSSTTVISFVDDSFVCGLGSFARPKLEELGDLFLAGNLEIMVSGGVVEFLDLGCTRIDLLPVLVRIIYKGTSVVTAGNLEMMVSGGVVEFLDLGCTRIDLLPVLVRIIYKGTSVVTADNLEMMVSGGVVEFLDLGCTCKFTSNSYFLLQV